jgi:glyceraldehyde-3-phosphate dehydrogenase (NADP+)
MIKDHPSPNRLRVCLGLDAKNPAFVLPSADLDLAVSETLLGALSYNGQRCTAIKMLFVHEAVAERFLPKLVQAVDALKMGLPWEAGVKITPLPEKDKPAYLQKVIKEAVDKGAKVINSRGNQFDRTFVAPSVVFPVTADMELYWKEQFGPVGQQPHTRTQHAAA